MTPIAPFSSSSALLFLLAPKSSGMHKHCHGTNHPKGERNGNVSPRRGKETLRMQQQSSYAEYKHCTQEKRYSTACGVCENPYSESIYHVILPHVQRSSSGLMSPIPDSHYATTTSWQKASRRRTKTVAGRASQSRRPGRRDSIPDGMPASVLSAPPADGFASSAPRCAPKRPNSPPLYHHSARDLARRPGRYRRASCKPGRDLADRRWEGASPDPLIRAG